MKQYIDKGILVAEIEKKKIPFKKDIEDGVYPTYLCALMDFEDFINTLEVKEVDLEKEIEKEWLNCDLCRENTILEYANMDIKKFRTIVNHFFELGLKIKGG